MAEIIDEDSFNKLKNENQQLINKVNLKTN